MEVPAAERFVVVFLARLNGGVGAPVDIFDSEILFRFGKRAACRRDYRERRQDFPFFHEVSVLFGLSKKLSEHDAAP